MFQSSCFGIFLFGYFRPCQSLLKTQCYWHFRPNFLVSILMLLGKQVNMSIEWRIHRLIFRVNVIFVFKTTKISSGFFLLNNGKDFLLYFCWKTILLFHFHIVFDIFIFKHRIDNLFFYSLVFSFSQLCYANAWVASLSPKY